MKPSCERYFPNINTLALAPHEPYISYEHWHRYLFAIPFVTGKRVLDIASGEGYGSAFLAEYADSVVGVDVSEDAVTHACQKYVRPNLRYLCGRAEAIPIPQHHSFDTIVSFETIEHLKVEDQEEFALEAKRLLKPDGVLLVSTPDRVTYSDGREQKNPYHLHEFTTEEFQEYLRAHFEHVRLFGQQVYPSSLISNLKKQRGLLTEYQIQLEGNAFQPVASDCKEVGYLIAVCSDAEHNIAVDDSLLLDLTKIAFTGIPSHLRVWCTSIYMDTGLGFRAEEVSQEGIIFEPDFTITFQLDPSVPCRALRWDPLETRFCQIRIREVYWEDAAGMRHHVELDDLSSNGEPLDPGAFDFQTLDPMVFLPISGSVREVTISGQCIISSEVASLIGLQQLLDRQTQCVFKCGHELETLHRQLLTSEVNAQMTNGKLLEMRQLCESQNQRLIQRGRELEKTQEKLASTEQVAEEAHARLRLMVRRSHPRPSLSWPWIVSS